MTKVTVERDGVVLTATEVSPKGIAEIVAIVFRESKTEADVKAQAIREAVKAKNMNLIEAVKQVRILFLNTGDERGTLKGALDFVRGF